MAGDGAEGNFQLACPPKSAEVALYEQLSLPPPLPPRSGFVLRSLRRFSRKREFYWNRLETFGNMWPTSSNIGLQRFAVDEKSPLLAGLSHG